MQGTGVGEAFIFLLSLLTAAEIWILSPHLSFHQGVEQVWGLNYLLKASLWLSW